VNFRVSLFSNTRRKTQLSVSLTLALLGTGVAWAFPPAPYYTLYGVVRDQVGQAVTAAGAKVALLKSGVEVGCAQIISGRIGQNYELNMRLDQNRSSTMLSPHLLELRKLMESADLSVI